MLDPIVQKYLSYHSPLLTPGGKRNFAIISLVCAILAVLGWRTVLLHRSLFDVLSWLPYTILGSLVAYLVISFLDRERRIRRFHFLLILSLILIFAPISAFFNDLNPATQLYTVGFVEEALKILPVLLLAIYAPNLISSKKDGIIYGALAGLGFNVIEIGLYIVSAIGESHTLLEAATAHATRFGLLGFGGHIIWSAFVGLGLGYAVESTNTGFKKWRRFIFYYLIAAVAHSLYDLGLSGVGVMPVTFISSLLRGVEFSPDIATPFVSGPLNDGMRYGTYIYNLIFLIVIIVQIVRSARWENGVQVAELSTEDSSVMKEDELQRLKQEGTISKRKYPEYPKKIGSKIIFYQNLLAMQKHNAAKNGDPIEGVAQVPTLREGIVNLRSGS